MAGELLAAVEALDRTIWGLRFHQQGPPGHGYVYRSRRGENRTITLEQWDDGSFEWDTANPFTATHDSNWSANYRTARQTSGGETVTRRVPRAEIELVTNSTEPPGRLWTDYDD